MSAKSANWQPGRAQRIRLGGLVLVVGGLIHQPLRAAPLVGVYPGEVLGGSGSVVFNPNAAPALQTQDQLNEPSEMDVFQPAGEPEGNTLPEIFRYGPLQLRPRVNYSLMYGNGIQSQPGSQEDIIIQQLSPGFTVDLGTHWAANYTPTFEFYSSPKFKDSMNQSASLTGNVLYDAWKFGLTHTTEITSEPLAQTAAQTDTESHLTTLSASRTINSHISADFSLNQAITLVSGFEDSYDWSTMDWINYEFWPRLTTGLGVGGGYILVGQDNQSGASQASGNLSQHYEQLQARVNWRATDKISFAVSGGVEDRQFETAGMANSLNPIFNATIQYQLFKHTQILLLGSRTVASSDFYLAAQQTETSLVSLNINQQLWRNYTLSGSVGYSQVSYNTPAYLGSAASRSDDMMTFSAQLSHPFYKRGTWSFFYHYSSDTSSEAGFNYRSSQVGMTISYGF